MILRALNISSYLPHLPLIAAMAPTRRVASKASPVSKKPSPTKAVQSPSKRKASQSKKRVEEECVNLLTLLSSFLTYQRTISISSESDEEESIQTQTPVKKNVKSVRCVAVPFF